MLVDINYFIIRRSLSPSSYFVCPSLLGTHQRVSVEIESLQSSGSATSTLQPPSASLTCIHQ